MRWKQFFTLTDSMDAPQAKSFLEENEEGSYTLLDVRQPHEYEEARIPGARLIPLPQLSDRLGEIDRDKPLLVYCAVGGRSRVAAQLLSGQGFSKVLNLKGGIKSWQGEKAAGPPEHGMSLITGKESPQEMIVLAFGMEEGLGSFYRAMAQSAANTDVARLFQELSKIEQRHKERLFGLYLEMEDSAVSRDEFDKHILPGVMEGGMTTEEFMALHGSFLETVPGTLELAMILETQALDLYMRFAQKSEDAAVRKVLHSIFDEEKAHLKSLGKLLEGVPK
ncbi:rhodanese-like domain-containing protein [Thermodesulfobacteriota bacterium]